MSHPQTSLDSHSATSSPASAYGLSLCEKQDGETSGQFGQCHARANLSARQAREQGLLMSGTSGPLHSTLLRSTDLQSFLENKLRLLLNGSILCEVTWAPWTTPWPTDFLGDAGQVDFVGCLDGRKRPVESGARTLVDAHPRRVGKLRAYGNGIDVGAASSFISAYMG